MEKFISFPKKFENIELSNKWKEILKIRDICNLSIEEKRANKEIGSSLEADIEIKLNSDLYTYIKFLVIGEKLELIKCKFTYSINRSENSYDNIEDWLREVVWYGNKKGAYLYGNISSSKEYDGHF